MMYKQCVLEKGTVYMTTWIPSKFAIVGKKLTVHGDENWIVNSVGVEQTEEEVNKLEDNHRRQRLASDMEIEVREQSKQVLSIYFNGE